MAAALSRKVLEVSDSTVPHSSVCSANSVKKTAGFSYRNRGRAMSALVCQLPQHFSYPRGPGSRHRLCAHSPLLFHSWYKQWKQMSRFSVSFLSLAPSPFPSRRASTHPWLLFNPPTTDLSHACSLFIRLILTLALCLPLSRPFFPTLAVSNQHTFSHLFFSFKDRYDRNQ